MNSSRTTNRLHIHAPAKVNLTLEIFGMRPDGYHELRSLLMPISLYESLEIEVNTKRATFLMTELAEGLRAPDFSFFTTPNDNLCVKAMRALRQEKADVTMNVYKRVPFGAGLGGGSADAAGVLRALNQLWGLGYLNDKLAELGATFASDVPAMVLGGPTCMEGRGERVRSLAPLAPETPELYLVLAFADEPISTREVYSGCPDVARGPEGCFEEMEKAIRRGNPYAVAEYLFNGLEKFVYEHYPHTAELPSVLRGAGAIKTLLSGSGGTVFGLAESYEHALYIQEKLPENLWSKIVSTNALFQVGENIATR